MPVPQAILPYPKSRGALPRNDVVDQLTQCLHTEQIVALTGMPGIGKTTCAVQFVRQQLGARYRHALWLDANKHPFELATNLSKTLCAFGLCTPSDINYENCEKSLLHLLFSLSNALSDPSILVIDNYRPGSWLRDILDAAWMGEHWRILIVSTNAASLSGLSAVQVPPMTADESERLLIHIAGQYHALTPNEVYRLCHLLEGHPLAICLYGRLLAANPALSAARLIEHLQTREVTNELTTRIHVDYDKLPSTGSEWTVLKVLQSAFLKGLQLSKMETAVLKTLSLLPDDSYSFEEIGKFTLATESHAFRLAEALQQLSEKGLLTRCGARFNCPELIKRVVYFSFWVNADDIQNAIRFMVAVMDYHASTPITEKIRYLNICEYLLPLLPVQNDTLADLYHALNEMYDDLGRHETALHYAKKELGIRSNLLQPDEEKLAMTYNRLGVSLMHNREFQEANDYLSQSLAIRIRLHGYEHYLTGRTIMNLGVLYASTANFEESKAYLKEAEAILFNDTRNPAYWKDIINVYNVSGDACRFQQQYDQCLKWYQKALTVYEQEPSIDPTDKHICCENLALGYLQRGNPNKARKWALDALVMRQKLMGPDHPVVGNAHYLLAVAEKLSGDAETGRRHFTEFDRIYRKNKLEGSQVYTQRLCEFQSL